MIMDTLPRQTVIDLTCKPLGPGWLRRFATIPEQHEHVSPHVWRTGMKMRFRDTLALAINEAVEQVLLCSFLLADECLADALVQAAERGVRVYIITASEQRLSSLIGDEDDFGKRMVEQHKTLLSRLAGKVLLRSAEHVHAKFLVVDASLQHTAQAWLSTANFNKALQDSMELGVQLERDSIHALAECFHWAFWCEAQRELRSVNRLVEIKAPPAKPKLPSHHKVVATLKNRNDLRETIIAMLCGARHEVLVSSYGLDANHAVLDELVRAAQRGVRVSVLTRPRPAVAAGVKILADAGIRVVAHDKLHAKALVVDGKAMIMTANFDACGLDCGFEVGVKLSSVSSAAVEQTLREWLDTFPWVYRADAVRGEHLGDFCPVNKGLREGVVRVIAHCDHRLPDIEAEDALSLDSTSFPQVDIPEKTKEIIMQRLTLHLNVKAPRLPAGATEYKHSVEQERLRDGKLVKERDWISFEPPAYQHKGVKYVVVRQAQEQEIARSTAIQIGARLVLERI
ncbi:phosphatidylserine/phosphatidylglycerophosphate/cardiolipin synthase family protein [Aeromonas hydrophila]|uniref:phospholipase D-like domain-containing protein n=1 Tax=Aeromonas hydrophila TaxID=644 RepID=UPI0036712B51